MARSVGTHSLPVMQYFVFKLLLWCAECGARFPLSGPTLQATCTACHSPIELSAKQWRPIFELLFGASRRESLAEI